jgi:DNA-directed RNA polymerase II subunit RPB2
MTSKKLEAKRPLKLKSHEKIPEEAPVFEVKELFTGPIDIAELEKIPYEKYQHLLTETEMAKNIRSASKIPEKKIHKPLRKRTPTRKELINTSGTTSPEIISDQKAPLQNKNEENISLSRLILPPPFRATYIPVEDAKSIPGEIVRDNHGNIFCSFIESEGFSKPLISTYDNWIQYILPRQIAMYSVMLPTGIINFSLNTDMLLRPDKLPVQCVEEGISYSFKIYVTATLTDKTGVVSTIGTVEAGQIPLMLGSKFSHVTDKDPYERRKIKECDNDPFGYFIIKGTQRHFLNQESLRMNRIFIYVGKTSEKISVGKLVGRMTCPTIKGTNVVFLYEGKDTEIQLFLHFMGQDEKSKQNVINVINAFVMIGESIDERLGIKDPEQSYANYKHILNLILKFTRPEWRQKVEQILRINMIKAISYGDPYTYLARKMQEQNFGPSVYRNKIFNNLNEQLFPHIKDLNMNDVATSFRKLEMLSIMVVRMVETIIGVRLPDDRDDWGNKCIKSAGKLMEQLTGGLWKEYINALQIKVDSFRIKTGKDSKFSKGFQKENFLEAMKQNRNQITIKFEQNFTGNWGNIGSRGSALKEGSVVTDVVKNMNITDLQSSLRRLNAKASRRAKQPAIRMVTQSQWGYVDATDTPEGENCGIVKNMSITCSLSLERDESMILNDILSKENFIFPDRTVEASGKLMLNGKFIGWCPTKTLYDYCISKRRSGDYYYDMCIVLDDDNYLNIFTDGARPIRPLLIVDPETGELLVQKLNLWGKSWDQIQSQGAGEYIDAYEQQYLKIATSVWDMDDRKKEKIVLSSRRDELLIDIAKASTFSASPISSSSSKEETNIKSEKDLQSDLAYLDEIIANMVKQRMYTHCELDPQAQLGVAASIIPLAGFNQGPRNAFQCNMGRQALGIPKSNYMYQYPTTAKLLAYPTRPILEPQINSLLGLNDLPTGQMVTIMIMTYKGYGIEDAFIFNKSSIDAGLFRMLIMRTIPIDLKSEKGYTQTFINPKTSQKDSHLKDTSKYIHLDENGLAQIGSYVKEGDILAVKKTEFVDGTSNVVTVPVPVGIKGVITRISKTPVDNGPYRSVKFVISETRIPGEGDKFAPRHAQKGTIGKILNREDMPYVISGPNAGMTPDIIFNPHAIPSRMTMGMMIEILASKLGAIRGERINASSFRPIDIDEIKRLLLQYGYSPSGYETVANPQTGKKMEAPIYTGLCYFQALKHHVLDKIQARGRGPVNRTNRQPIKGRLNKGGLRTGEMERDAIISHGASGILKDRFCLSSDAYKTPMCRNCGQIAISDVYTGRFKCDLCEGKADIGKLSIPYSYKLLAHILIGMGIRITHTMKEV